MNDEAKARLIVLEAAFGAVEALRRADEESASSADKLYFQALAALVWTAAECRSSAETMLLIGVAHAITTGNARQAMLMLRDGFANEIRRANGTPVSPNLN